MVIAGQRSSVAVGDVVSERAGECDGQRGGDAATAERTSAPPTLQLRRRRASRYENQAPVHANTDRVEANEESESGGDVGVRERMGSCL